MNKGLFVICILVILSAGVVVAEKQRKIKVLGPAKGHEATVLVSWFTTEPSTDATVIATRSDVWVEGMDIQRYMRIYFPRNYQDLLQYEFILMAQVDLTFFTDQQEMWIFNSLGEGQKGGVNTRSVMSALASYNEPWRNSIISQAFPNDVDAVLAINEDARGPIRVNDGPDIPDIMKSFKPYIEAIFTTYGGLVTVPKPGSVVLSYMADPRWDGPPERGQIAHVFYWEWEDSKTWTFEDMVTWDFWKGRMRWNPYALDIISNIIWFSTGRELPPDPIRVHELRTNLFNFRLRRSILINLVDFAEKFGANPTGIYSKLGDIDEMIGESEELYLDWQFSSAADLVDSAMEDLLSLEGEASELKDRALLWIFLLEWLVTLGVSLIAGTILWSLMIRRKLYREVGTTRGR
ncbi:MAG: hypothetical protein HXS50_02055 [Theionarchaea archaeon]|nr:hypothetical protein [Theionarchaea archaeon]